MEREGGREGGRRESFAPSFLYGWTTDVCTDDNCLFPSGGEGGREPAVGNSFTFWCQCLDSSSSFVFPSQTTLNKLLL